MDDGPVRDYSSDNGERAQLLASYGGPAYIRRAKGVQEALEALLLRCRRQRETWLILVRTRLALLKALAGDWAILRPLLANEEDLESLSRLHDDLKPTLRVPVTPTTAPRKLRRALRELNDSLEHFNRRWHRYLSGVDLTTINELRDGYNRFYVMEKECAVRSLAVARQGFERLEPFTHADLFALLPPLPLPCLAT